MAKDPELYKALLGDEEDGSTYPAIVKPSQVRRTRATKKGTPCWCKCLLFTLVLGAVFASLAAMATYFMVKEVVEHMTVTTPHASYPVVQIRAYELEDVKHRVEFFMDQLEHHQVPAEPLVITQHEINGLLCHSDYLRGNIMVTLNEGSFHEEYSLPTWMLPGGKDRYFVGSDNIKLDTENQKVNVEMEIAAKPTDWFDGPLFVAQLSYLVKNHENEQRILEMYLDKGVFFGQEAPQDYIDEHENILEHMFDDEDGCDHARAVMEGVDHVAIEDGKISVYPRARN